MAEKTDEELIDDLLAEVGRAAGTWGFASYHSAKRMALSARVAALRTTYDAEPVAWVSESDLFKLRHTKNYGALVLTRQDIGAVPLYAAPPPVAAPIGHGELSRQKQYDALHAAWDHGATPKASTLDALHAAGFAIIRTALSPEESK